MPTHNLYKIDTGYTKICPECHARHGVNVDLINKTRLVDVTSCINCKVKRDNLRIRLRIEPFKSKNRIRHFLH